jgi:hypothetical protein
MVARFSFDIFRRHSFVIEPHFNYWKGINDAPLDSYLMGYWQSEKYFINADETIRKDFNFKLPMGANNVNLMKEINEVNAISLHVRRGDYANNVQTTATHGLCSIEYYHAAILHMANQIDAPNFFIFSDDIAWVKENLKIDFPHTFVNHNFGLESYNDMRLMSLCKHNIIANSTFSWWGAWLNSNKKKIVIAPKRWFANETIINTQDLIPYDWVRL